MKTYTFNIIADGAIIATETLEAKSEKAARGMINSEIKANGGNPANFQIDLIPDMPKNPIADAIPDATANDDLKIILSPANSPMGPNEPKRIYPPSIKHETLGTFWGCDQAKLLDTIRLNPHALDHYMMRQTGSRANFYLGTTLIWATTKPIAAYANELALQLIAEMKSAA